MYRRMSVLAERYIAWSLIERSAAERRLMDCDGWFLVTAILRAADSFAVRGLHDTIFGISKRSDRYYFSYEYRCFVYCGVWAD